jgi:hypothetical protein
MPRPLSVTSAETPTARAKTASGTLYYNVTSVQMKLLNDSAVSLGSFLPSALVRCTLPYKSSS